MQTLSLSLSLHIFVITTKKKRNKGNTYINLKAYKI